jgi:hypothetical protein
MLATSLAIVMVCLAGLIGLGIIIAVLKFFSSGTGVIVGFALLGWMAALFLLAQNG